MRVGNDWWIPTDETDTFYVRLVAHSDGSHWVTGSAWKDNLLRELEEEIMSNMIPSFSNQ